MRRQFTLADLKSWLSYDPETGEWTWLVKLSRKTVIGSVAGSWRDGYIFIGIDKHYYAAHQLAWFYMTGEWPERVDHEDTNGFNNRWVNLRLATRSQNAANRGPTTKNVSGYKGVSWSHKAQKWVAYIGVNGRSRNLGYFEEIEDAAKAYAEAAIQHFGDFARTG